MSKEKQIEEMTETINELYGADAMYYGVDSYGIATALYNADYRKQEWISVEDRLPTYKDGKVLIYTAYGISIGEKTVSNRWRGDNAIPKQITHWMPLPEAPKMEGGE